MTAVCASCHINFASKRDLMASNCHTHHDKAELEQARAAFTLAMDEAWRLMPDVSPMNYPPAKKAWAKVRRLEEKSHA